MSETLHNNKEQSRYEIVTGEHTTFADYRLDGSTLYIDHVETPPSLRGTGSAGRLMQLILDESKANGYKIVPICGYAAVWLQRHK